MPCEPFTQQECRIILLTIAAFLLLMISLMKCDYENQCAAQAQAEWRLRQQAWKGRE